MLLPFGLWAPVTLVTSSTAEKGGGEHSAVLFHGLLGERGILNAPVYTLQLLPRVAASPRSAEP